jgi:F-type H+-transporting ATPase subunit b
LGIFEQLGINPELIVVNIIGFIVLLAILKKFLYGPITQMLEARAEDIRSSYEAADAEKARMEELRADYEGRLADIESEARKRIQETVKEAQGIRDQMLNEARENADKVMARAEAEIGREREKVVEELRREVVDLTIAASGQLIGKSLDQPGHKKLVDEFIQNVGVKKS